MPKADDAFVRHRYEGGRATAGAIRPWGIFDEQGH
jgi:hypothetical protein